MLKSEVSPEQRLNQIFGSKRLGIPNHREIECSRRILNLKNGNSSVLANYLIAYKRDNPGIAHSSLTMNLLNLVRFAEKVSKPFAEMTRDDLLEYLYGLEKPESIDPNHRWKGFYNLFEIIVTRFFKWSYYPDISANERPKPAIVIGLKKARPKGGKKRKRYGPGDMWASEDNEVFLKYCPDPRIKGYHALAIDTGARPHELLKLKIEDIIWPPNGEPPIFDPILQQKDRRYFK